MKNLKIELKIGQILLKQKEEKKMKLDLKDLNKMKLNFIFK